MSTPSCTAIVAVVQFSGNVEYICIISLSITIHILLLPVLIGRRRVASIMQVGQRSVCVCIYIYTHTHFPAIAAYSFQFSLADMSITLATVYVCDSRVRDGTHTFTQTECVFCHYCTA